MEIGGASAQGIAETYTFPVRRANQVGFTRSPWQANHQEFRVPISRVEPFETMTAAGRGTML